jgi:hypothetical protein
MDVSAEDLKELIAIVMGISIVLIPITGWTLRFALRPVVDAIGRYREITQSNHEGEMLEKRIALLERQMANVDVNVERLVEEVEFHRRLSSPPS